jgi:ubiquinone/menaquinone biosynthesis C-methylase UbiE
MPAAGWKAWLARWERFQATYVPEREVQFDTMCRYAIECASGGTLCGLDLCAGPGSLGAHLLARAPSARIVAVDADPFLIEMGRRGRATASINWVRADLRCGGWSAALVGPYDAALCSTATHWFNDEQLRVIYRETAELIRHGGALLVGDTMPHGTTGAQAASRAMLERLEARRIVACDGEDWVSFWRAAEAEPAFADLLAERERVLGRRNPRVVPSLDFHLEALADAGFTDVGEVWRRDAWGVVLAVR